MIFSGNDIVRATAIKFRRSVPVRIFHVRFRQPFLAAAAWTG